MSEPKTIYIDSKTMIPVSSDPRGPDDARDTVDFTIRLGTMSINEMIGMLRGWASTVRAEPEERQTIARITID